MQGWIKLHRKMLENPVVCKDSDHLAVWVYLLLNATHDCYPAIFKGKKISLQPGQLLTGRKTISKTLVISESKVQRILTWYESEHQIEQLRGNTNRLISIVKWDEYQSCEQLNEQRMNNCRTTDEQLMNTNKNVKNIKNDKKDIYSDLPKEIHEPLREYISMRKSIKKTMTNKAIQLLIGKLQKLSDGDIQLQISMLEEATIKNWLSVYLPKEQPKQSGNPFKDKLKEMVIDEQERGNGGHVGYQGGLSKLLQEPDGD